MKGTHIPARIFPRLPPFLFSSDLLLKLLVFFLTLFSVCSYFPLELLCHRNEVCGQQGLPWPCSFLACLQKNSPGRNQPGCQDRVLAGSGQGLMHWGLDGLTFCPCSLYLTLVYTSFHVSVPWVIPHDSLFLYPHQLF